MRPALAKSELGTKRLCAECGAKYYDLNRDPILCPKCGATFELVVATAKAKPEKAEEVAEKEDAADEDETDGPVLVSLEDADDDDGDTVDGDDDDDVPTDIPDVAIDDDDDDAADDDTFLEDDDEEDDMSDIIPTREGDDET